MPSSPSTATTDSARPAGDAGFWRQLAYRWFVEYNPLYLLSAALVLGGCSLLSRGLTSRASLVWSLGIAGVGEVYALSLLGGAALLTRIGPRRPAVMLALLFLLYQWDLTLHTETCAYLGAAGAWAAAAWVGLFVGKIYAVAWALRVRFAKRIVGVATLAAVGLAAGPHCIADLGPRNTGALLALWLFALGALRRSDGIASLVELSPWGQTVLRRVTRAAWLLSGVLLGVHVLVWAKDHEIALSSAHPVLPLLFLRRVRSEARSWAVVLATCVIVALATPSAFFVTALLSGAALVLRALSPAFAHAPESSTRGDAPEDAYRASGAQAYKPDAGSFVDGVSVVGPSERARSFAGALFAVYLAAWTIHWSGGAWPAHVLALDVALSTAVLLAVKRLRVRSPLAPLAACYVHFVVQARLLPPPQSSTQWGATAIALGFVLLGGSLVTSYRLRANPVAAARR